MVAGFFVVGVRFQDLRSIAERCVWRKLKSEKVTPIRFEELVSLKQRELFGVKRKPKILSAPMDNPQRCADFIRVAERDPNFNFLEVIHRAKDGKITPQKVH